MIFSDKAVGGYLSGLKSRIKSLRLRAEGRKLKDESGKPENWGISGKIRNGAVYAEGG